MNATPATREEVTELCAKMGYPELAAGFLARQASRREVVQSLLCQPAHGSSSASEHSSRRESPVVAACRLLAEQRLASIAGKRRHAT